MTTVRCPKQTCMFWQDGLCTSEEIEIHPVALVCLTFEEWEEDDRELADLESDDLEWDDDVPLAADELDESNYESDPLDLTPYDPESDEDDEPELEDEFGLLDENGLEWRQD